MHALTFKVMETLTFNDQFSSLRITSCFVGGCHCVSAFKVIGQTRESEAQLITTEHPPEAEEGGCQKVGWNIEAVSIQVSKGPLDVLCLHLWGVIRDGKGQSDTLFLDSHNPSLDSLHSGKLREGGRRRRRRRRRRRGEGEGEGEEEKEEEKEEEEGHHMTAALQCVMWSAGG